MNVSAWSIRNPIPAVLLFVMLTLSGLMAFKAMRIQQFMDIDLPTVTVTATLPGAAPAQMETEVGRKIENAVATLQGIKHIYTKIQDGTATVTVEFRIEKPTQEALDDVRDAVSRIRADLPGDLRDPVITKMNVAGAPILTYTIESARMDEEALSWFVDNNVAKILLSVRGVGAVARVGGVTREIRVELDPDRLQALRATAADVSRQLRQIQQEASGGRSDVGGIEQSVRTIATVHSAEEIGAMEISLADGRRLRLDALAKVSDTVAEQRSAALLNGKPVIGFEITRSRGAGEVEVAEAVRAALEKLKIEHPDMVVTEAFNFVDPVVDNFEGSMALLIEGAVLAVIVVWLFLRDGRATFVSATALPLSVIPTFGVMYLMGFTLNVVTLLSMSLVVGILVDDAIVEIENIMRHLREGKPPYQAAMEAADEIGLAVIATTFTLIAVFLPTAFMSGVPGKFFVQFGWTAAIAVFFSLVVARMLTPMMAAYLLRPPRKEYHEARWLTIYVRWVTWCLQHRPATLFAAAVFFFGSFALVPLLPTGFMPPDDLSQTQVYISLPPRQHLRRDARRGGSGTAHRRAQSAREDGLYRDRRRRRRQRSLRAARGGGSAQGDADHQPDAAQGAWRRQEAGRGTVPARGIAGLARCAGQGRARRLQRKVHPGPGERERTAAGRPRAQGRTRPAHHPRHRRRHQHGQPDPAGTGGQAGLQQHGRPRGQLGGDCRRAADCDRRRLRPEHRQAEPRPAPGAHRRQAAARGAPGPRPARTPDGAGQVRPGDDRRRGQPHHHRRPRRDRPLRPPAQHQFRDRTQRPAAGRSGKADAGPAQPEDPAAGNPTDHGGRCRGDGGTVRELCPGDADRRVVHLRRAGAAVQGLRAAGDHPGGAGAVGAGGLPSPCS
jgi:preprotein translocase subunit SecF